MKKIRYYGYGKKIETWMFSGFHALLRANKKITTSRSTCIKICNETKARSGNMCIDRRCISTMIDIIHLTYLTVPLITIRHRPTSELWFLVAASNNDGCSVRNAFISTRPENHSSKTVICDGYVESLSLTGIFYSIFSNQVHPGWNHDFALKHVVIQSGYINRLYFCKSPL